MIIEMACPCKIVAPCYARNTIVIMEPRHFPFYEPGHSLVEYSAEKSHLGLAVCAVAMVSNKYKNCESIGQLCSDTLRIHWAMVFKHTVNPLGNGVQTNCESVGQLCSNTLRIHWAMVFKHTENPLGNGVQTNYESIGQWCSNTP
jgi:hypothetical protein